MSPYPNIHLSDPLYESANLRQLTFKSSALRRRGDVTLFIPQLDSTQVTPLVILLHGVYGSHWSWSMKGGAHLTAAELIKQRAISPMVIAMPSDGLWGDGSGYLPHEDGPDYERWIMDDVAGCVREIIPAVRAPAPLFLAGLSMGGYGALRLGAKYVDRVAAISAHSAITHPRELTRFVEEPLSTYGAWESAELDPLYWAEKNKDQMPPLRFDCGKSDPLLESNRRYHQALVESGVPHTYVEFEGEHNWTYWSEHLRDTLIFFEGVREKLD